MIKLQEQKIIALKYDFMFCQIFNNEENISILEEFIADYFNYNLEDVKGNIKIVSRKLKRISKKEPSKEVDLLLKYKNQLRNIEISTSWSEGVRDRNVLFLSKIHGEQEYNGYEEIKQTIQINLLAFNYRNKLKSSYYMADTSDKNNIHIITKKLKMDIISMAIGKNMCYTGDKETDKIIKWSKIFMSETKEELEENLKLLRKNTKEKLLSEVLNLSGDEDMLKKYEEKTKWELEHDSFMYDHNKKMALLDEREVELDNKTKELNDKTKELDDKTKELKEKEKQINEMIENSNIENNIEIARKMLVETTDINFIARITGFSTDEIIKLKNS